MSPAAQFFERIAKEIAAETQAGVDKAGKDVQPLTADGVLDALSLAWPPAGDQRAWEGFERRILLARAHAQRILSERWYADALPEPGPTVDTDLVECLVQLLLNEIGNLKANDTLIMRWRMAALRELGFPRS